MYVIYLYREDSGVDNSHGRQWSRHHCNCRCGRRLGQQASLQVRINDMTLCSHAHAQFECTAAFL